MNWFKLDLEKVKCPYCKSNTLRTIKDNKKIIEYVCSSNTGCGSVFIPYYHTNYDTGIVYCFASRKNTDYFQQLNSVADEFEIEKKTEELHRAGILFYTNNYFLGLLCNDEK